MTSAKILRMIDAYKNTLKVYGLKEVKLVAATQATNKDKNRRFSTTTTTVNIQEFDERIDCLMVLMCRTCPYLTVLVSI